MTTAATNHLIQTNYIPFCDMRCKGVRVLGQFVGRTLYALVLLVVSLVCRIFSKDLASIYFSMANVQSERGGSALDAYLRFGSSLIDFSYNGCMLAPSSDTEQNALRARYGSQAIDPWLQVGTEEIPLKLEKLKRAEGGICLGMSFDFIKQYLQEIQRGVSPMQAVREISSRYVTGAPDSAQLAQIFYRALDRIQALEKAFEQVDREIEEQEERLEEPLRHTEAALAKIILSKSLLAIEKIEAQQDKIVGQQFGLQLGPPEIYVPDEPLTDCTAPFIQFLTELPNGCYKGRFRSVGGAHGIALIKSDDHCFLFDPNIGTLAFGKHEIAEKLWEIGKSSYLTKKAGSLSFSACRLQ
jgi:hypothetical protein